ncbi:MAG: transporter substrate-binding domain-containing protein [Legionellaceae bacterium]|nr:transporter substrate-binding domain-containing protein [Legionellaceae bacterium]
MRWIAKFCLTFILCLATTTYAFQPIVVGIAPEDPPLSSRTDNKSHFMGFEVDIMNALCTQLKLSCVYKEIKVSEILPALESGKIDIAIAAILIPSDPIPGFIFSHPYLPSNAQFMTLKASDIKTVNDLSNKRIGVRLGTLNHGKYFENFIQNMFQNQLTVKEYLTMPDLLAALSNQNVDAIFSNEIPLQYWFKNNMNFYKMVGAPIPIGNGYGLMTTTKQSVLIQNMNQVMLAMMADGRYTLIYNTYFESFK